jgi:hypothetical protein
MQLDTPFLIGAIAFAWTMWAVLFWGSIAVIERHNPFNTFGWALVWSAVEIMASVAIAFLSIAGIGMLVAWLIFLFRLLLQRYELGLLHTIGVVIVTIVGPYFAADAFLSFVGSSQTLLLLALYGFPLAVLVVWRWPRPTPQPPTNLPPARVQKLWRAPPAPVAVAPPAPVAVAPPAPVAIAPPPPVAAAPPAPVVVAPPAPRSDAPAPRADGEPSFLR